MPQKTSWSAGQVLAQAEGSIGTTVRAAVADYYKGRDLSTAQTIRRAETDTEATRYVTAIRQGRVHEVVMVAASAALGAVTGALSQKAVNNATVGGVPPVSVLGAVPTVAGMALPISLSGRSMLAAGGLSYITGAMIWLFRVEGGVGCARNRAVISCAKWQRPNSTPEFSVSRLPGELLR